MTFSMTRRYGFEAAHYLPFVPEGHKCRRLHGHNFQMEIRLGGEQDQAGFVMDFWELDRMVMPILDSFDHHLLNDIIMNPTSENIAQYVAGMLHLVPPIKLLSVIIWENPDCSACYFPD